MFDLSLSNIKLIANICPRQNLATSARVFNVRALDPATDLIDHSSAHQPEIAGILWNLDIGNPVNYLIPEFGDQLFLLGAIRPA